MSEEITWAARLCEEIRQAAARAKTEEDLRIAVEKRLEPALKDLGISAHPRYEMAHRSTLLVGPTGYSDAVYGHAVLEYEVPGTLSKVTGVRHAEKQLRGYLEAQASRAGEQKEEALKRMVGVGLDGNAIFFLRYKGKKAAKAAIDEVPLPGMQMAFASLQDYDVKSGFQRSGPVPVTEESIGLFLLYLRALRKRQLTAEALAEEFGPRGEVASQMLSALYNALQEQGNPQVETFFNEWKRIFGIVYGQEVGKAQREALQLASNYRIKEEVKLPELLFAVHTYYALFMKMLAAELVSLQDSPFVAAFLRDIPALGDEQVRDRLRHLEDGGPFQPWGIVNLLEGDFFRWYLEAWNEELAKAIQLMAQALSEYEPATGTLKPEATKDLLKELYEILLPRKLRHVLGEYYTPDWLAELVLDQAGYQGDPNHRLLDPACGSGTFLVLAIKRALEYASEDIKWRGRDRELLQHICLNIVGFDINPLAVIAARTNYLLALGPLRRYAPFEIPVYLCDSVLTPSPQDPLKGKERPLEHQKDIPLRSTEGVFWIPEPLVTKENVEKLSALLESCVRDGFTTEQFVKRAVTELGDQEGITQTSLAKLYERIAGLEAAGKNGLWARIIKNGLAPMFQGQFDFVVGNPPWVRWGYLSDEYRRATEKLWVDYGLFSLKGMMARLGAGEKDFSMLFLYACVDTYLKNGRCLGFVITQEVFKGKGAGEGFRRFRLGSEGAFLKVVKVDDLVAVKPFERAANKTATIALQKGLATEYPVPYTLWRRKKGIGHIESGLALEQVAELTERHELQARPIGDRTVGSWQTVVCSHEQALEIRPKACFFKTLLPA